MSVGGPYGPTWAGVDSDIAVQVRQQSNNCLRAYAVNANLVLEHANIERATAQGGYGRRQLYELVQNGADALISMPGGRIELLLTESALYCANEGRTIDSDGVTSLLGSHISLKRGNEIGRFGLGFKSVLGVTGRPEFYSRAGSFVFDAEWAAEVIRPIVSDSDRYPVLRVAQVVDPVSAAERDPILADLMRWATTIVKLPRDPVESAWLSDDLGLFPREFLLFSPHVGELLLHDRVTKIRRQLFVQKDRGRLRLVEGDRSSLWRVFSKTHVPSDAARKDAGELADRESLPIIWAVPVEGRAARGRFWAFFPTEYFTTLSGILNAPWKTNEDRQNLLAGAFNSELLDAAADLIVSALPELAEDDDPARPLDLIPARGRESPNPADEHLTESVYRLAKDRPCIPDQTGRLQAPGELHINPDVGNDRELVQIWSEAPSRPVDWCHFSVETRDRRSRALRLLEAAGRSEPGWAFWLESIVNQGDPAGSIAALRIVSRALDKVVLDHRRDIERARIVLTDDGRLVQPRVDQVFLPGDHTTTLHLTLVHKDVAANADARNALERLGIKSVDPIEELEAYFRDPRLPRSSGDWNQVWLLIRKAGKRALEVLGRHNRDRGISVRTVQGSFQPIDSVILPGAVVRDGDLDKVATVDIQYHQVDLDILRALGVTDGPARGRDCQSEPWFTQYRHQAVTAFMAALPERSQHPYSDLLGFKSAEQVGPLEVLRHLSDESRLRFTNAVLETDPELTPWLMVHETRSDHYPSLQFPAPHVWLVVTEGRLNTSKGLKEPRLCVGPGLERWSGLLPVAAVSSQVGRSLGLAASPSELTDMQWTAALEAVSGAEDELSSGAFYALAAGYIPVPTHIRARVGDALQMCPTHEVTVVTTRRELEALRPQATPTCLVESAAQSQVLVERWGLRPADTAVTTEVFAVPAAPEAPILDEFPGLRWALPEQYANLQLQRCTLLRLETFTEFGKQAEERSFYLDAERIYWRGDDDADLLRRLRVELRLELSDEDLDQILVSRAQMVRTAQIVAIREQLTLEARLAKAVGSTGLRRRLPAALVAAVKELHGPVDDTLLARLALAVYGLDVLKKFRDELQDNGLEPPAQWAGSGNARRFVRDLGFSSEYAGFEAARREPLLEVYGPPELPPLHDFQNVIRQRVQDLLHSATANRAILSLPTGAGKTRIVVEALVDELASGRLHGPVLWVAQSDELCEQAVQSWSYLWRALGGKGSLSISRLWSGNEALALESPWHVVVATIDKLQVCMAKPEYAWLMKISCLIVDEAHESTEKSYSNLLDFVGLDRGQTGSPLIGLTATPYRGTSESDTMRLVRRYGESRLDQGVLGDDPYATLQQSGVLARVRHRVLAGAAVDLSASELAQLTKYRMLPASVEDRLGRDASRTRAILEAILALPRDWPILLFATSVDHAETMAALLALNDITAVSISANTDPGARHLYIEQFRAGSIRVLTNYAVLTQGFDAPKVRAIVVARPTYSPNLYQQMIGRGLRGPRNQGTEECLIVTVQDNVRQYGEELAFHHFEHLWKPTVPAS